MPRTIKKTAFVALVGLISLVGLGAFSQQASQHAEKRQEWLSKKIDQVLQRIQATPEQTQQIHAIRDRVFAERPKQADERGEFIQFWREDNPDPARIHAQVDERAEARRVWANQIADALVEIHGILTPEQRSQVADMLQEAQQQKKSRRGQRGQGSQKGQPPAQ